MPDLRDAVASPPLLERDAELRRTTERMQQCRAGRGGLVVVNGGGGLGKTAFLDAVTASAARLELSVCRARATEFEQTIGFGVVRQLFEPRIRELDDATRARVFAGAAELARPIVTSTVAADAGTGFAVLHGLYWLAVQMAAEAPLLLVVDDAQWADESSRAWLEYLRLRIDELPLLALIATRPVVPGRSATIESAVSADRSVTRVDLEPLQESSVAQLVARRIGRDARPELVAEVHHETGGNPFLVRELLDTAAARGVAIDELAPIDVRGLASDDLQRRTRHRLTRLGRTPTAAANALAILGEGAHLRDVARVADLEPSEGASAVDTLAAAGFVEADRPMRFVHPLIQSAVLDSLAPYERSALHARAADALVAAHADPEPVALHLVASEPAGSEEHVEQLRRAASIALHRGASTTATTFLGRALVEPAVGGARADVLRELAEAELVNRDPAAVEHLEESRRVAVDAQGRARAGRLLASARIFQGSWDEAVELLRDAQSVLGDADPDLAGRIEADLLVMTLLDDRTPVADRPVLETAEIRARAAEPSQRSSAVTMALVCALEGRCQEVSSLVRAALASGRLLDAETSDAMIMVQAVDALVFVDALDEALALAHAMVADGERRGSVLGVVAGLAHCGFAEYRIGALIDAEADLHAAFDLAQEHDLFFTLPFIAAYLSTTLLARGEIDRARAVIESVDADAELAHTVAFTTLLEARGAVRLACGDRTAAADDLRTCGEAAARLGITNPNACEWRTSLVTALRAEDPEAAKRLADEQLELAVACGSVRARGIALRDLAALAEPTDRIDLLGQSVEVLTASPARFELATSLLDLGAALSRNGYAADARPPLLASLQLATECGATALAQRALEEARLAGARARRAWSSGAEALTPAERRVARLAAEGRTNQEIAQALFVTTRTVKAHLGAVYRKLSISGRTELAAQL